MLEIATAYAEGGAEVLPLHSPAATPTGCSCGRPVCDKPAKHPRCMHGLADATDDVDKIRYWWRMWPTANIGIRPRPGQFVLDVDPRNGGFEQLAAMQKRFGPLPTTRTARTGGDGWHYWFRGAGDVVKELAPGLDLKGNTGYLVAAPSVHASGQLYRWTDTGPIAEAPDYLLRLAVRPPRRASPVTGNATPAMIAGWLRVITEAPKGTLNNRLFWACARAHEYGIDVQPFIDAAVAKGHPRRGAEATADSAATAPPRKEAANR